MLREAGSVLRGHNSGMIWEPHCYVALSVRCREVVHILVCTGKNNNYAANITRHRVKFSRPGDQTPGICAPWPILIRLFT